MEGKWDPLSLQASRSEKRGARIAPWVTPNKATLTTNPAHAPPGSVLACRPSAAQDAILPDLAVEAHVHLALVVAHARQALDGQVLATASAQVPILGPQDAELATIDKHPL